MSLNTAANAAHVDADASEFDVDTFYARELRLAFGVNREDKNWRTTKTTLGELISANFQYPIKRGKKDGPAMTQGALVGLARKSKTVQSNYLVMVDIDVGVPMDNVATKARERGLYVLLWDTFNSGKPESDIPESKLVQFLRKDPEWLRDRSPSDDPTVLAQQCADYLGKIKKIVPHVVETIEGVEKKLTEKGMLFLVKHAPMPRVRALFVLDEPFDFAARGTQDDAIDEWKDRYAGFSEALGLPYDPSCVDPARLMYLPRIARDADEMQYNIREVEGRALKIDDMPRLSDLGAGKAANDKGHPNDTTKAPPGVLDDLARAADRMSDAGSKNQWQPKTPGLKAWLAKHANDFEIEEFFEAHGLENRDAGTTGTTFECPTDGLHSDPGNPNDKGFWAQNASMREGGFACSCSHATCKQAAQEATGKVDRAWFLDEFCAANGLGVDDLLEYCPAYVRGEDAKHAASNELLQTAQQLVGEITPESGDKDRAIAAVAKLDPASAKTEELIDQLCEKAALSRRFITGALKTHRQRNENARKADKTQRNGDVWPVGNYDSALVKTVDLFESGNNKLPRVFYNPFEAGYCRIESDKSKIAFEGMSNDGKWAVELGKHMRFRHVTQRDGEISIPPPAPIIAAVRGTAALKVPTCNAIVRLPMFSKDGTLRTQAGFDEASGTYLAPWGNFRSVPEFVTAAHLDEAIALLELTLRDFPFSDVFAGIDPLPVRIDGDVDDDGFPLPNYGRGVSSRANALAMMIAVVVRNMIDGPTPIHLLDKPKPGTGAGFLLDLMSMIAEGKMSGVTALSASSEEMAKQITAKLRSGDMLQVYDNINHHVDSAELAAALTAGAWKGRILGLSEMTDIVIACIWIFSANYGSFSPELMRRIAAIRMDANTDNPTTDRPVTFYKLHSMGYSFKEWITEKRLDLVWALHVLVKNWLQERAKPGWKYEGQVLPSFEAYSETVGGVLQAACIPGFLANRAAYMATRDDAKTADKAALQKLFEEMGTDKRGYENGFTCEDAFAALVGRMAATGTELEFDILPDERNDRRRTPEGMPKAVGRWLAGMAKAGVHRLPNGVQVEVERDRSPNARGYKISPKKA